MVIFFFFLGQEKDYEDKQETYEIVIPRELR